MVKSDYIPMRGDLIWIGFNPQSGHEQAGKQPALVVSPIEYNRISGLCILFPITGKIKGYPFEVEIKTPLITGVILADQIKSLDWKTRNAQFICQTDQNLVEEVISLFETLIIE